MGDSITERRRLTRNRMYRLIYDSEIGISKQQIANEMECSMPTVHQNIAELLEANLIKQGEFQPSSGGRPAIGYVINNEIKIAIGVSLSSRHIRFIAVDMNLKELASMKVSAEFESLAKSGRLIRDRLEKFIDKNGLDRDRILGVGITIPAVVDNSKGMITVSPTLNIKNESFLPLTEHIDYPTYVENDGTCAGAAEAFGGGEDDFAYLFMEYGIGGALYANGQMIKGQNGRSAEFGHICVHPGGLKCSCGKKGCLEAYCGASRYTTEIGLTAEEFFAELDKGNENCTKLWNDVLNHLTIAINNIRMMFDSKVILGGFVSEYLENYMPKLRSYVAAKNTFEEDGNYLSLGKYYKKGGMMGGASYFIKKYIEEI